MVLGKRTMSSTTGFVSKQSSPEKRGVISIKQPFSVPKSSTLVEISLIDARRKLQSTFAKLSHVMMSDLLIERTSKSIPF